MVLSLSVGLIGPRKFGGITNSALMTADRPLLSVGLIGPRKFGGITTSALLTPANTTETKISTSLYHWLKMSRDTVWSSLMHRIALSWVFFPGTSCNIPSTRLFLVRWLRRSTWPLVPLLSICLMQDLHFLSEEWCCLREKSHCVGVFLHKLNKSWSMKVVYRLKGLSQVKTQC